MPKISKYILGVRGPVAGACGVGGGVAVLCCVVFSGV